VTKFQEHNHEPSAGKVEITTTGTSDTTVRYTRTKRKGDGQGTNSGMEDFIRNIVMSKSMEYPDGLLTDGPNNGLIPAELKDTKEVKFSTSNTRGAGVILTYKDFQYSKVAKIMDGATFWLCRFNKNLKCLGYVHFKDGKVTKSKGHNHEPSVGKIRFRLDISTMGTSDTTIRYSKSRAKRDVLHFCGYEYLNRCNTIDGRIRWICRQHIQKNCKGFVYTRNGQIDGVVREHSHLPINDQPAEKKDENKMLSSLLL